MQDLFYIVVTLFTIAIIVVLALFFFNMIGPELQKLTPTNSYDYNVTNYILNQGEITLSSTWDSGFAVVFILMVAASMILSSLLPTNPIWFIPFIFVMILLVTITYMMSELWNGFVTSSTFASTASQFTFIPFLMSNLSFVTAGLGFMMAIIMYVSWNRGG